MSVTTLTIENPSPSAALYLSRQTRVTEKADYVTEEGVSVKRDWTTAMTDDARRQFTELGAEMVSVTVRNSNRETLMPRWQADDFTSLPHWVTTQVERAERASFKAPVHQGVRMLDEWEAPRPLEGVAARGRARVQLSDAQRILIECNESIAVSVSNPSSTHSLRLRQLNAKSGDVTNVAILPPSREYQESKAIEVTPKLAAVIEQIPS